MCWRGLDVETHHARKALTTDYRDATTRATGRLWPMVLDCNVELLNSQVCRGRSWERSVLYLFIASRAFPIFQNCKTGKRSAQD